MRIHETGGENATATVDHFRIRVRVLEIACGADHGDATGTYGYCGVPENPRVAHLIAFARAGRTGAGDNLRGVNEKEVSSHFEQIIT